LGIVHTYRSEMAQNFWTALWAFGICFLATAVISSLTRQEKSDDDMRGLVYSLTPKVREDGGLPWYARPATLAVAVLAASVLLNVLFW